jgi:hypothetical protein
MLYQQCETCVSDVTLQGELQEDELELYHILGRGGYGTVYHGTPCISPCVSYMPL